MKNNIYIKIMALMLFVVLGSCDQDDTTVQLKIPDGITEVVSIYHDNPKTGLPYTGAELAALRYDPGSIEEYYEDHPVVFGFASSKLPMRVEFFDVNGDLITTYAGADLELIDGEYRTPEYSTTIPDLGVDLFSVTSFSYKAYYDNKDKDFEGITVLNKRFSIKHTKFIDPNSFIDTFVYLQKSSGETVPLRLATEDVTSRVKDVAYQHIVEFNGSSNQVEVEDDLGDIEFIKNSNFSVGFWVNTTSTGDDPVIVGNKDWGSGSNAGFLFALTGGTIRMNAGDSTNRIDINGPAINDGEWHYLACTFDTAGDAILYSDGVEVDRASIAGFGNMTHDYPIRIAQDGTGSYGLWYEGKVGQVLIHDWVLTPDEVASLSSKDTGVYLRTDVESVVNLPVTNHGDAPKAINDGRITYDFQGGTYVEILDDLAFRGEEDYSFTFWTNYSSMASDPCFMGDKDWGSGVNVGFCIYYGGGNIRFNSAGDGGGRVDNQSADYSDGQWHKVVCVVNRTEGTQSLYVDGVLGETLDISTQGNRNSGMPWNIGNEGTGSYNNFIGKIAETVIYNYALSPEQVDALFN
ncbi:LamG domain-containing protein [Arenibacter sp. 6A1]|uniref:LamG domain-containing protein n=1 Tax=Arenibacter sp. 6A1 TaxID=2720391 RepID=UPI001448945F|nr:LamG domain-containing protein [Arenibacter sp. 6A1]NKI27455.1 LamG domain-containing protein [Arenibacter sp. 6A1]